MSDPVFIALIGAAQTIIVGFFAYKQHIQGQHIEEIKTQTNGMNEKLQQAAHAAGVLDEKGRAAIEREGKS